MGFIDEEAVAALVKKVEDVLRPLGVTTAMDPTVAYDPTSKQVVLQIVALVGESAFDKLGQTEESKVATKEMHEQLNEQKEQRVKSMVEKAREEAEALARGEDIFSDPLERECPNADNGEHSLHPDGFCVLCHAGMG